MAEELSKVGYQAQALTGKQASVDQIKFALSNLANSSSPNDILIVQFAGMVFNRGTETVLGADESLAGTPSDRNTVLGGISLDEVAKLLSSNAQGRSLVILDGPNDVNIENSWKDQSTGRISVWVGKGIESESSGHGIFTYLLLAALMDYQGANDAPLTLSKWADDVNDLNGSEDAETAIKLIAEKPENFPIFADKAVNTNALNTQKTKLSLVAILLSDGTSNDEVFKAVLRRDGLTEVRTVSRPNESTLLAVRKAIWDSQPGASLVLFVEQRRVENLISKGSRPVRAPFRQVDPVNLALKAKIKVFLVSSVPNNDFRWTYGPDPELGVLLSGETTKDSPIFTKHFLEALAIPGLTVQQVAEETQRRVLDDPLHKRGEVPVFLCTAGPLFVVNPGTVPAK